QTTALATRAMMNDSLHADTNGVVKILFPEWMPGSERLDTFSVFIQATNHTARTIMWLSSTGNVLNTVSTQSTVRLESGISVSGTVEDAAGQPLSGVKVRGFGNSYRGYT